MATFGATVHNENDALNSVLTGLEMIEALEVFNIWQREKACGC